MALQFNYLFDKGAFTASQDGRFAVNVAIAKSAVRDLAHELLTIEATGDYARAKKLLTEMAILRPNLRVALDGLKDIPTDINPSPVTADSLVSPQRSR
jgi:hypothetical protein